ncbi:hypothetical protein ABZ883_38430 [Streptomyces sp. NPDC046977]|uniref:hypothetical protein n=1 Tax=Streptomyces sp. NPDC046977 TaxID=3154703 RepID=UPI00340B9193
MPTTRLLCRSEKSAAAVVAMGQQPADFEYTIDHRGPVVLIGYRSALWPLDIAEWAALEGHATDQAAAHLITTLPTRP